MWGLDYKRDLFAQALDDCLVLNCTVQVLDDHHVFVEPASKKTSEAKRDLLSSGQQIVVGNLPYGQPCMIIVVSNYCL
jgi:hypothetical protein